MNVLERYLTDCENKRRRMRARPSDAVLTELRSLLDSLKDEREGHGRGAPAGRAPPAKEAKDD
jgi:hypothetical protein